MSETGFAATTFFYTYKFEDSVKKSFREKGIGESVNGKIFSPVPGYQFQLRILNVDAEMFAVYLKNCGEDEVHVLEYKIQLPEQRRCSAKRKSFFNLKPQACKALTGFPFNKDLEDTLEGLTCDLKIDATARFKSLVDTERSFEGFEGLQDDPTFADATLICSGVKIPCHRVILGAKSKIFKTLFSQKGFKEARSGQATIYNLDIRTLKEMLRFIYTNSFDPKTVNITELLSAAAMYDVRGLVRECENILLRDLDVGNAIKYFRLIHLHSDCVRLKSAVMDVIAENIKELKKSPEFTQLNASAITEILEYVAKKNIPF